MIKIVIARSSQGCDAAVALNQSAFALSLRFLGEPCMGAVDKIKILTAPHNLNRMEKGCMLSAYSLMLIIHQFCHCDISRLPFLRELSPDACVKVTEGCYSISTHQQSSLQRAKPCGNPNRLTFNHYINDARVAHIHFCKVPRARGVL